MASRRRSVGKLVSKRKARKALRPGERLCEAAIKGRRPRLQTASIGGAREERAATGQNPDQTAILRDLATCSLIGSTASAIVFWVSAPMSLVWLVIVSTCLRANWVWSAITSDSDLAANTDFRKSKFASALTRNASKVLALTANAPSLAAAKQTSNALVASSAAVLALAKAARDSTTLFSSALRKLC